MRNFNITEQAELAAAFGRRDKLQVMTTCLRARQTMLESKHGSLSREAQETRALVRFVQNLDDILADLEGDE